MFNSSIYPYAMASSKTSLLAALKNIKWGTLLSNTQKTLGVINQAIPIAYQIKPIWNNAKTIFKIVGAIKDDNPSNQNTNKSTNNNKLVNSAPIIDNNNYEIITPNNSNNPSFFL